VYLESSEDATLLKGVKVSNGRQASAAALLRRDIGRPAGIGFIDDETFAYWAWTGRSDVLVVEAAMNGRFQGQKPRRVGQGSTMPVWSPDGRWLAWSAGGIRVAHSDGRDYRSFRPSLDVQVYPAWSHDSRQLAFWDVSRMGGILKVADLESATTREVWRWSHPQVEGAWDVAWMPGGRELRVQTDSRHHATLDTVSGDLRDIREQTPELGLISPDRRWRAFCDSEPPYPIHAVPLDASSEPLTLPVSGFPPPSLLGWWPDGSLLEIRGETPGELWRRPLKGPAEPLGIVGTNINSASVAPDAKRVAYVTQTYGQELWTLPVKAR